MNQKKIGNAVGVIAGATCGVVVLRCLRERIGESETEGAPVQPVRVMPGTSGGEYVREYPAQTMFVAGNVQGVRGLKNTGNTCFINAVLQSLASIPPFVRYLEVQVHAPPATFYQRPFTHELVKLLTDLKPDYPPLGVLNPKQLQVLLADKVERFRGYEQQDAQELFQMVMRLVSEEAEARPTAPRDDSESFFKGKLESTGLMDIVEQSELLIAADKRTMAMPSAADFLKPVPANPLCGSLASLTRCAECLQTSIRVEPFVDLSLTLPEARDISGECFGGGLGAMGRTSSSVKLATILDDFTHEQLVEGVECIKCGEEMPKRAGAFKSMLLARPPETLCLHFPRRHPNPNGLMMKLRQHVDFPLKLDVTRFCCGGGHRNQGIAETETSCDSIPRCQTTPGRLCTGPEPSLSQSPATTKAVAHVSRASRSSPQTRHGVNHALVGGSVDGADGRAAATTTAIDGGSRKRMNGSGRLGGSVNGGIDGIRDAAARGRLLTAEEAAGEEGVEYDLRAVIVHVGGAEGGHYTAYRNLAAPGDGTGSASEGGGALSSLMSITQQTLGIGRGKDSWVSVSDEIVQTVSVSEVLASQAYMLFYGRRPHAPCTGLG